MATVTDVFLIFKCMTQNKIVESIYQWTNSQSWHLHIKQTNNCWKFNEQGEKENQTAVTVIVETSQYWHGQAGRHYWAGAASDLTCQFQQQGEFMMGRYIPDTCILAYVVSRQVTGRNQLLLGKSITEDITVLR